MVEVHQHDDGKTSSETVYDAGYADLKFHYGSSLDQCHGFGGRKDNREKDSLTKILSADVIELLICDNCFKERHHLCDGYDTIDYAPIKAKQQNFLIEVGQWLMSPEGQAEMAEVKKQAELEELQKESHDS